METARTSTTSSTSSACSTTRTVDDLCHSLLLLLKKTSTLPPSMAPSDLAYLLENNAEAVQWTEHVCRHVHEDNWITNGELDVFEKLEKSNKVLRGQALIEALQTLKKPSLSSSVSSESCASLSSQLALLKAYEQQSHALADSLNARLASNMVKRGNNSALIEQKRRQVQLQKIKGERNEAKEIEDALNETLEAVKEAFIGRSDGFVNTEPGPHKFTMVSDYSALLDDLRQCDELMLQKIGNFLESHEDSSIAMFDDAARSGFEAPDGGMLHEFASLAAQHEVLLRKHLFSKIEVETLTQLLPFAKACGTSNSSFNSDAAVIRSVFTETLDSLKPKVDNLKAALVALARQESEIELQKAILCIYQHQLKEEENKERLESYIVSLLKQQRCQQMVLELLLHRESNILSNVESVIENVVQWTNQKNEEKREKKCDKGTNEDSDNLFEELLQDLCGCQGAEDQLAFVTDLVEEVDSSQLQRQDYEQKQKASLKRLEESKASLVSTLDLDASRRHCISHVDVFEGLHGVRDASKNFESQLRKDEVKWDGMRNELKNDSLRNTQKRLWIDFLLRPKLMEANVDAMEKKAKIATKPQ